MDRIEYQWAKKDSGGVLELVHVETTGGRPYTFGEGAQGCPMEVRGFHMATVPVTQALWTHVMGADDNPSAHRGENLPLENVSWDEVTRSGGFLDRLNASAVRSAVEAQLPGAGLFRLPTEAEWEYAARGGPHWPDGFRFSGSNDADEVAWYDRRHGDHTQPVALKKPNQLGIYDMSGNVWEWCQDVYTPDVPKIPTDGTACDGAGVERVLRGGCFHNWAVHCTVSKRYEISRDGHDGCIGFRIVFTET